MLFNEPKLLKYRNLQRLHRCVERFSALQRAEIAEIVTIPLTEIDKHRFSALQRAEIAEMDALMIAYCTDREFQCSSTSRNC